MKAGKMSLWIRVRCCWWSWAHQPRGRGSHPVRPGWGSLSVYRFPGKAGSSPLGGPSEEQQLLAVREKHAGVVAPPQRLEGPGVCRDCWSLVRVHVEHGPFSSLQSSLQCRAVWSSLLGDPQALKQVFPFSPSSLAFICYAGHGCLRVEAAQKPSPFLVMAPYI